MSAEREQDRMVADSPVSPGRLRRDVLRTVRTRTVCALVQNHPQTCVQM